jgi:hypothetical protein
MITERKRRRRQAASIPAPITECVDDTQKSNPDTFKYIFEKPTGFQMNVFVPEAEFDLQLHLEFQA